MNRAFWWILLAVLSGALIAGSWLAIPYAKEPSLRNRGRVWLMTTLTTGMSYSGEMRRPDDLFDHLREIKDVVFRDKSH